MQNSSPQIQQNSIQQNQQSNTQQNQQNSNQVRQLSWKSMRFSSQPEESPANREMSGVSMPARVKSICEFQRHTIYKHTYIHMYTNMYIHIIFVLCSFNISDLHAVNARKVPRTLGKTRQVSLHCTILLRTMSELT